eukprot:scaffold652311_cov51-Prasinocladus_malaysianus.AAC.2
MVLSVKQYDKALIEASICHVRLLQQADEQVLPAATSFYVVLCSTPLARAWIVWPTSGPSITAA